MSWRRSDEPSYPAWGGSNTKGATQLISKRVSAELIRGNFLMIHPGVNLTKTLSGLDIIARATAQSDSSQHGSAWQAGRKALRSACQGFALL